MRGTETKPEHNVKPEGGERERRKENNNTKLHLKTVGGASLGGASAFSVRGRQMEGLGEDAS